MASPSGVSGHPSKVQRFTCDSVGSFDVHALTFSAFTVVVIKCMRSPGKRSAVVVTSRLRVSALLLPVIEWWLRVSAHLWIREDAICDVPLDSLNRKDRSDSIVNCLP